MAGEYQFKKSLLGFDRRDVADYIENLAKRHSILKNEKDKLESRCAALESDCASLSAELEALRAEKARLSEDAAQLEGRAEAAEQRAERLETELEALKASISEYREKAAIYDAARDRIAGLELSASRRAAEIEKQAEARAAALAHACEAYIASVKAKYIKVSDETRQSSEFIISELNRLSDRLSVLSALLGEKADAFDFIEPGQGPECFLAPSGEAAQAGAQSA